jgi:hypothetical protein
MTGQSIVYAVVETYNPKPTPEPSNPLPVHHPEWYSLSGNTWERVSYLVIFILSSVFSPDFYDGFHFRRYGHIVV